MGVIVTGGSSGIGRATALALAESADDVAVTTRSNVEGAERTCELIRRAGRRATWMQLDLSDPGSADSVISELSDRVGGLRVLVNNAGVNRRVAALEETVAEMRRVLDVNLVGPLACAQAAARCMATQASGGVIINVTSVLAQAPLAGAATYCASKAGLDSLTRVLALEWAARGIRVNAVAPGHTATPMNYPDSADQASNIARSAIPLHRAAEPAEIASAIAFLASGHASYATGAVLTVDGGLLLISGPTNLEASDST